MKRFPLLALLAACATAHPVPDVAEVQGELDRRLAIDQEVRKDLMAAAAGTGQLDPAILARMQAVDRDNTAWLKGVLAHDGWITIHAYGKRASHQAWLLVQHADDRAFQQNVLAMLERAVPVGDASGADLAYLDDRLAATGQRPQRYGTQGNCVPGGWEPTAIDDPAGLDARRQAVGMSPMAEYRKESASLCAGMK